MQILKILFVVGSKALQNPMCSNWINGLSKAGHQVATVYWQSTQPSFQELTDWGITEPTTVFNFYQELPESTRNNLVKILGGRPDILFGWEGVPTLKPLQVVKSSFPEAKTVFLIDTYPNAPHFLSELLHNLRYGFASHLIDAYVFYSKAMRQLFSQQVFFAKKKLYLALIEPFLESAFDLGGTELPQELKLERIDNQPYIVFTGNAGSLWSNNYKDARDAVGSFLSRLAERGVHIFVNGNADLKNITKLHHYPAFSNTDLLAGRFAKYISQFDAHLIFYNELNNTIKRRVASGLSTRLAFALTSTCPIAISQTSQFVHEYWGEKPFGFMFKDLDDLVESLHDSQKLSLLRSNMEQVHRSFSFEAQSDRIHQLFKEVMAIHP
ncbi:hypothetical protein [Floridanema evergladense]|uniref:Uncharacterized protein n=1 Tax=Floridaenema evergladense BLCC-F167 TaxID=3153639 RepID=A0ABV4WXA3_9CYAN